MYRNSSESVSRTLTVKDCVNAELTIQRFGGGNPKSLSATDKNALIASLCALVIASEEGFQTSPSVSWLVNELGCSFNSGIDQMADT